MQARNAQASKPVSLSQCVAVIVTFRRLLAVCGVAPLVLAASPFVAGFYLSIMDYATSGFGFLSTAMAVVFTFLGRSAISVYAPTSKQQEAALAKSRVFLPLLSFVLGQILISYVLYPLVSWFGLEAMLKVSPELPYMAVLRLSACMLLLGAAILVRFLGPVSIVRCSETPLRSHPMSSSIQYFWARCTSLDAFLGLVAAPSDKPGELIATSFPIWRETIVRYQRPSLRASVGQILLSTTIGFVVAHLLPVWHRFSADPPAKMMLLATCVLTLLTHLMISTLDGSSHELDPKRYQSVKPQFVISFRQFPRLYRTFGSAFVAVPAAAIALVWRVDEDDASELPTSSLLSLAFLQLFVTTFISIYLILINEASKTTLCMPGLRLEQCVKPFSSDAARDKVIVMAESILQGNTALIHSVLEPTRASGVMYAEDEELKRGVADMERMAKVLLFVDRHIDRTDVMLENDILCMLIMEALGGSESNSRVDANAESGHLSPRHLTAIKQLADPQNAAWLGAARREPNVVPVVRALCTYAGGMGDALYIISLPPNSPQRFALNEGSMLTSWSLPPGARACAEWAIRAAARLVAHSLGSTKGPASDWRSSSLSVLVPVVLHAAFTLRKGAMRFARLHQNKGATHDNVWFTGENAALHPIIVSCDESALLIVQIFASMGSGSQFFATGMSSDCRVWVEGLVAATTAT